MKAAIITYTDSLNWGAQLQAYALRKILVDMGVETNHIDHRKMNISMYRKGKSVGVLVNNIIAWGSRKALEQRVRRTLRFREKYLAMTEPCHNRASMKALNDQYDMFITGSDQVWNCTNGINSNFYLDFVEDDNKKCSYAASFGVSEISEQYSCEVSRRINCFRFLTVRENDGKNIIKNLTGREAEQVCDPVFLLTPEEWTKLIDESSECNASAEGGYIFVYSTDKSKEFYRLVADVKKKYKLPVVSVSWVPGAKMVKNAGPAEFLDYIKNAEIVVTTSFHATAFATIFKRKLCVLPHKKTGNRVIDVLGRLGGLKQIADKNNADGTASVDYHVIDANLQVYREESRAMLKKMIDGAEMPKTNIVTIKELHEECTGCRVCEKLCPKDCITFEREADGFLYPHIDETVCIKCSKCVRVCHLRKDCKVNYDEGFYGYSKQSDIRRKGSSGGAFSEIASAWNEEHENLKVFGSIYDSYDCTVHQQGFTYPDIEPLYQSKYAFSDTKNTFNELKEHLEGGGAAVYCGTPCQIGALKAFLDNKEYENLLTIDFICHGVPSEEFMKKHLEYIADGRAIKNVEFRSKAHGWGIHKHCLKITYSDNKTYVAKAGRDYFFTHFLKSDCLRNGCYHCHYSFRHSGDFTMGDFWEINRYRKDLNDGKGMSVIFTNTQKSKKLVSKIKNHMILYPIPKGYQRSRSGTNPKFCNNRKIFFNQLENTDIYRLEEKFKKERPLEIFKKLKRKILK